MPVQYVPPVIWVDSEADMDEFVQRVRQTKECALDTETTGLDRRSDHVVIWSACPDIDHRYCFSREMLEIWDRELSQDPSIVWYFTNQTFDFSMIENSGARAPVGDCYDTLAMDWMYDENRQGSHGLKDTAKDHLGFNMREFKEAFRGKKKGESLPDRIQRGLEEDFEGAIAYSSLDAWATFRVFHWLKEKLQAEMNLDGECLWDLFVRVEMPFTRVLYNCCRRGIMVDVGYLQDLVPTIETRMTEIQKRINKVNGAELNLKSPLQLRKLFFDKLKLKPVKYTKGGESGVRHPSTDEECLNVWASQGVEVAQYMVSYRELAKILGTYVNGLMKWTDRDLRIHPTLTQHVTVTGRLSSVDPNLQNLPRPDGDQFKIRSAFIPMEGHVFGVADYCVSPEMRILTKDLRWIAAKDIRVGTKLIGFDEKIDKHTRFCNSEVLAKQTLTKPCYSITMSNGTILTSSYDHSWVVGGGGHSWKRRRRAWVRTEELEIGDQVAHVCEPWEVHSTRDAGYLAGILDGEGWVAKAGKVGFAQKPNTCLRESERILSSLPLQYARRSRKADDVQAVEFYGSMGGLRALGMLRPARLLSKSESLWLGKRTWSSSTDRVFVTKKEFVGHKVVIALQTSSRTFIAEGFLSHNCQLEMRLLAHFSEDVNMIGVINRGWDIHTGSASLMYGYDYEDIIAAIKRKKTIAKLQEAGEPFEPLSELEKAMIFARQAAKTLGFALNYGEGPLKLSEQLGITLDEAKALIERYFEPYPNVRKFIEGIHNYVLEEGRIETILGRVRRFPEMAEIRKLLQRMNYWSLPGTAKKNLAQARRQAGNSAIQGSAADVARMAMILCEFDERLIDLDVKLLLQIHDELIFEIPEENVEFAKPIIRELMEHPLGFELLVPLPVDMGVGYSWATAKA